MTPCGVRIPILDVTEYIRPISLHHSFSFLKNVTSNNHRVWLSSTKQKPSNPLGQEGRIKIKRSTWALLISFSDAECAACHYRLCRCRQACIAARNSFRASLLFFRLARCCLDNRPVRMTGHCFTTGGLFMMAAHSWATLGI